MFVFSMYIMSRWAILEFSWQSTIHVQTNFMACQPSAHKLFHIIMCIINVIRLVGIWKVGCAYVGGWVMRCATTTATTTASTGATSSITTTTTSINPLRLLRCAWRVNGGYSWIAIGGAANLGRIAPWRGAVGARCFGACDVGLGASVATAAKAPGRGFCSGRTTRQTKPWDYRKCNGSGGTCRGRASGTGAIERAAASAAGRTDRIAEAAAGGNLPPRQHKALRRTMIGSTTVCIVAGACACTERPWSGYGGRQQCGRRADGGAGGSFRGGWGAEGGGAGGSTRRLCSCWWQRRRRRRVCRLKRRHHHWW